MKRIVEKNAGPQKEQFEGATRQTARDRALHSCHRTEATTSLRRGHRTQEAEGQENRCADQKGFDLTRTGQKGGPRRRKDSGQSDRHSRTNSGEGDARVEANSGTPDPIKRSAQTAFMRVPGCQDERTTSLTAIGLNYGENQP